MNFKELETLGYSSFEIAELQDLGVAELVISAHARMETVAQEEKEVEVGAPLWATTALALFSVALLAAPWAGEIGDLYRRERLAILMGKEVIEKQPVGWNCPGNRQSCYPEDMYERY
jgi:hypothetical protein